MYDDMLMCVWMLMVVGGLLSLSVSGGTLMMEC